MARHPAVMRRFWDHAQAVMQPDALDAKTKELIYLAVSIANGCHCCAASHTAQAKQKGVTEEQLAEMVEVVALALEGNTCATFHGQAVDAGLKDQRRVWRVGRNPDRSGRASPEPRNVAGHTRAAWGMRSRARITRGAQRSHGGTGLYNALRAIQPTQTCAKRNDLFPVPPCDLRAPRVILLPSSSGRPGGPRPPAIAPAPLRSAPHHPDTCVL